MSLEIGGETRGSASEVYDYAYYTTMQRIEDQGLDQAELAKEVLAWITCSKTPVTRDMLQKALGARAGEHNLDEDDYPDVGSMVSVCAGLVELCEQQDEHSIMRLVHYTTQEYFERTGSEWFSEAEAMMAIACITYLNLNEIGTEAAPEPQLFYKYEWDCDSFYSYAATYWGVHARHLSPTHPLMIEFLSRPHHVGRSGLWGRHMRHISLHPLATTALHLTAYFGLEEMTVKILGHLPYRNDIDKLHPTAPTPLMFAASESHEGVTRLLLESGAKITTTGNPRALKIAVVMNREAIVRLLLSYCSADDLGLPTTKRGIVLHSAAHFGYLGFVKILLDHKMDADGVYRYPTEDQIGTPLYLAAGRGHISIVKLLIEHGANKNSIFRCDLGRKETQLDAAVRRGWVDTVKVLLDNGAHIAVKPDYIHLALTAACKKKQYKILKMLFKASAHVDPCNNTLNLREILLLMVALHRWEAGAKYLFSVGANIVRDPSFDDRLAACFKFRGDYEYMRTI